MVKVILNLIIVFFLFVFLINCNVKKENDYINDKYPLQKPQSNTIINIDEVKEIDTINAKMIWNNNDNKKNLFEHILFFQNGPDSTLLLLDLKGKIVQLSQEGKYIKQIGEKGSGPGEYIDPVYMTFANNKIFIADPSNNRIEVLNANGEYLYHIDKMIIGDMRKRFAVGPNDIIIGRTLEPDHDLIVVIDSLGNVIRKFGDYIPYGYNIYQQVNYNNMSIFYDNNTNTIYCVFENIPIIRKYNLSGEFIDEIKFVGNKSLKNYFDGFNEELHKNFEAATKKIPSFSSCLFVKMAYYYNGRLVLNSIYENKSCIYVLNVEKNRPFIERILIPSEKDKNIFFYCSILCYDKLFITSYNNSIYKQKYK